MKKTIALLCALVLLLGCVGCAGGSVEQEPDITVTEGVPSYADDCEFEIGAYCPPAKENYEYWDSKKGGVDPDLRGFASNITEQEYQDYKDAGFTFMMTEYNGDYDTADVYEESDLYPMMEMAEKVGIDVYVHSGMLTSLTSSGEFRLSDDSKAYMQRLVNDLKDYECFRGFSLRDEPITEYARAYEAVSDYLLTLKSDAEFFTCMRPMSGTLTVGGTQDSYADYVDTYLELTNEFVYDFYPLWNDPIHDVNYIDTKWYTNMEMVASKAKNYENANTGITVQSGSWGRPGAQGVEVGKRSITTKADVGFQLYSALAYGFKTIGYFTYWLHWCGTSTEVFYDAMVMPPEKSGEPGVKTETYYAVQAMNQEIKKFDHVLMNFDWQGTAAVTPAGKTESLLLAPIADYKAERIQSVTATEDTIVGHLKDKDGYDGFMIVNSTEPSDNKTDTVTIDFYKASKALCYIHGEQQMIDLTDGSYTFEIGAGEGVFVIPIV